MKKLFTIALVALTCLACNSLPKEGPYIKAEKDGSFTLYIDGEQTYVYGVGGTNRPDMAAASGANAMRTWGTGTIERDLELAAEHGLYVMQGVGLTKRLESYYDEEYKERMRQQVRELAEKYKDNKNLLIWGLGNEIQLDGTNNGAVWGFVNELSEIIKSIDSRHLTSTVISHDAKALDSIAKYAPSLDVIGINSYGNIENVAPMVEESDYKGAYLITEWGPTGWWQTDLTEWGAPIEQTSEEKREIYEYRHRVGILEAPRCLGSFCFYWDQKEERTPTWFCMFVEDSVEGLPLNGEKTPMVEAMQRSWTGEEPEQVAPVVEHLLVEGVKGINSPKVSSKKPFTATINATDADGDKMTYVWEVLKEATITGTGGAWEPRPDRVGEVVTTEDGKIELKISEPGNYRLYVYVLDGTGYASTANAPFQVQ